MTERDEEREQRIKTRIIVDAYGANEQAYGWHAYLDDTMDFPFEARCITQREESPLKEVDEGAPGDSEPEVINEKGDPVDQYAPPGERL